MWEILPYQQCLMGDFNVKAIFVFCTENIGNFSQNLPQILHFDVGDSKSFIVPPNVGGLTGMDMIC